ncbi:hypothetical protein PHYSODRAFT_333297 [Phytophthora sojae]|uniref:FYVE-type domain-containing protein n=1 Tax=Phytophthora sojae (strain P6497) TaxID=1094619 RepID=G4ZMZ5_PHYSP|nr:hypothetical protein PHYSODRAFT_333297 [Phytophthora sojae]EGZ15024.1 hypothetical protein PHYSODRAFT_333297 [Phytophthora sojae]|eukprot:XP_009528773.1 hypothetical protein PHYSODRAFT_333297 [Phytophthora sojae]
MARDRDFPLPRELLPDLDVSQRDYVACKDFSARLLGHTVRAFEHFAYDRLGEVDTKFWKPQATRDELSIYRERQPGRVSESLGDSLHRCAAKSPLFSVTPAAITPATMMLTGVRHGFVENAVSTLVTKSQEELALVIRYLHGASSDCGILHTMESPTDADPFHFLGFKYYVSQAVGDPRLLKRRHCVYLEDSGFTRTRTGEKLGYHIMHSVHLPQFPDLRSRNSIPALMSTRFLYRQREEGIVEVFMLGNIDIKGLVVKPISLRYAVETMFNMTRLLDCSETKRLTLMAREHLCRKKQERRWGDSPVDSDGSPVNDPNACSMCERVGNANVVECLVCGRAACSRCRASKQVFVSSSDGLLGRLIMVPVCTGCILDANTSFFDMLRSQRRGRSRSSGFRRNTLDYRPSSRSKRRGGSCRTMDVAMRSPSVDRRQRYTSYCKEDKSPLTPETLLSSPEPCTYSSRQLWADTPRRAGPIRLTPREASITIEERRAKPIRRSRSKPPPVPKNYFKVLTSAV